MDAKKHTVKLAQASFFILFALMIYSCPAFCEDDEVRTIAEAVSKEYKSYLNEFYRAFGKEMEKELNLKWVEGGYIHNFSSDEVEFYAHRRATLEEARALELLVMKRLTEEVQADPKLLSHLNRLSLSPESLGASIGFVNLHNWGYDDGSIDKVYFHYSKKDKKRYLHYTTTDPFSDYSAEKDGTFNTDYKESFEDAVKLNATASIINPAIHNPKGFEEELDHILTSFKKEMKEKHGLFFRSSGWMVAGNPTPVISEIRTKCMYHYPVDCQEARTLMLLATERLLAALNDSKTLRPYLKDYHFSANQVKMRMLFRKNKHFVGDVPYYDGSMESAVLNGDIITYYHHIPNAGDASMHDRVIYAKESYQEAQKTLANAPPLTLREQVIKGIDYLIFNFDGLLESASFIIFMILLFVIASPQSWLFIIPLLIIINLRRKRRSTIN